MPLSFGIPLGLVIAVVGTVMFRATTYRRVSLVMIGLGATVVLGTLVMIAMAVNSGM